MILTRMIRTQVVERTGMTEACTQTQKISRRKSGAESHLRLAKRPRA
jgi:hypothetical protein